MKILILLTINFLKKLIHRLYWIYKLLKVTKGTGFKVQFPIRVGGTSKIKFGHNCSVQKNVYLGHGDGSKITFGNNCKIDENVEIVCSKGANIHFGDNCWVMKNTIIRTANNFEFGNNVNIATNCAIFSREAGHEGVLKIGNGTHIGDGTIIDMADNLTIEEEIAIGPNCIIYTHDHDYTKTNQAAWKGGVVKNPITIKKGAWIASSVTILPKVEIGERCVIAAGAVVTKSTDANTIYGGTPAKKIKEI